MNYFEIINRILQELKYPTVTTFANLVNPEHLLIKSMVNTVNREVLLNTPYNCREVITSLTIPASSSSYTTVANTINGEIKKNGIIVNSQSYNFVDDISVFIKDNASESDYTVYGDNFYFGSKSSERIATILSYTFDLAKTTGEVAKSEMALETDLSIIPTNVVEQILVYGTCFKFKGGNSSDARLAYWLEQYNGGINILGSYNQSQDQQASLKIPTNIDIRRSLV